MMADIEVRPPRWASVVATFFGVGRIHPGPGTWGSAATILLWWALTGYISPSVQPGVALLLTILAVAIGIPAATQIVRATGIKDPQYVVIDEVAGQLLTLVASPATWKSLLVGFILFRGFDIVKPPPIRMLERFPEGVGIVVDDLGAGLYALAIMQVLQHFSFFSR
jgi:phosphatidylglycerophosphatase A